MTGGKSTSITKEVKNVELVKVKQNPAILVGGLVGGTVVLGGVMYAAITLLGAVVTGIGYLGIALPFLALWYFWPAIAYNMALQRRKMIESATRNSPLQALQDALQKRVERLNSLKQRYQKAYGLFEANKKKTMSKLHKFPEDEQEVFIKMMESQQAALERMRETIDVVEDSVEQFGLKIEREQIKLELAESNKELAEVLGLEFGINPAENGQIDTAFNQIDRMFGEAEAALELAESSKARAQK